MAEGREHASYSGNFTGPSYCTLPIFHPPQTDAATVDTSQHISSDGHHFNCPDPAALFHVIFVLDRSWSMLEQDIQPLRDEPIGRRIAAYNDNRFGVVLSAFYQFMLERSSATRRDAYSVILFNDSTEIKMTHETTSSINQMIETLLGITPTGGTDFRQALVTARQVMEQSWSAERSPVIIFLSDGEGLSEYEAMTELCDRAAALGKLLSFWSISLSPRSEVLREMAAIAKETAMRVRWRPDVSPLPCGFRTAINTVQLANAFSGIATSLRKILLH
ncbi:hypothetical protein FS837_002823 [Tulasnella sp. UAMH 9824]|nr:hypothetical protein FS837_002823 [Tulasnella sp. UAMH 9824]